MVLNHTNKSCFFIFHPYRFTKKVLFDFKFLEKLPTCDCFQFAILHNNPNFSNYHVSEEEFEHLVNYSEAWKHYRSTDYRYNLNSGMDRLHRDPFVKEAFKIYDPPQYYNYCDANKTPKTGRMYYSLLQYLYPRAKPPPVKEVNFYNSMKAAINFVFREFDRVKPITYQEAMHVMPKNTSAGFNGLQYSGSTERKRKDEILPYIEQKYLENAKLINMGYYPNDYCILAMRGHLSKRTQTKTRPIWLVSASTIVAELRYYQPFYEQINTKPFFRDRWITGKQSLPRLNRFLRRHPDATFINTDISSWDSYRAQWFHDLIMKELGKKIDFQSEFQRKEFQYCINSAIRTKVLFPNGEVYQKLAGIISGTAGTLLFNSLLNTIAGYTILHLMKLYAFDLFEDHVTEVIDPNWLGDDFCFFTYYKFDLETFSRLMFKYFNVLIKPEKTVYTDDIEERKYLGYQLKSGFLYRAEKEFIQALLYTERPFPKENGFQISFSRFFSYLLLGGINNYYILDFFYMYMGYWKDEALKADYLFHSGLDNIFKLLKDVWNVNIPSFNLSTFRNMNMELMKYVLLYQYDLQFTDLSWN